MPRARKAAAATAPEKPGGSRKTLKGQRQHVNVKFKAETVARIKGFQEKHGGLIADLVDTAVNKELDEQEAARKTRRKNQAV